MTDATSPRKQRRVVRVRLFLARLVDSLVSFFLRQPV
jgi:hypothetical protein